MMNPLKNARIRCEISAVPEATIPVSVMVKKIRHWIIISAFQFSIGRKCPFKAIPRLRKMENTAAASVAETMAPSNKPSVMVKSKTLWTKIPTAKAVTKTPE